MTNDTASILAKHQRHELGMSSGTPDTCACGAKVMPDPRYLAADGTIRNITDRRDEAFAAHQAEMLKPAELDAAEYRNSYTGATIKVGDRVRYWWGQKQGTVKRVFKKHPKSVWYLTIDQLGRDGEFQAKAADCEVIGR